jgi:hypothetical protein
MIIINSEMAMSRKVEMVVHEDFGLTKKNREKPYTVIAFSTQV